MSLEARMDKLEARHDAGGLCEKNRTEVWQEIGRLRERIVSLEVKLLIGGTALSILGPMAANWILKHLS